MNRTRRQTGRALDDLQSFRRTRAHQMSRARECVEYDDTVLKVLDDEALAGRHPPAQVVIGSHRDNLMEGGACYKSLRAKNRRGSVCP